MTPQHCDHERKDCGIFCPATTFESCLISGCPHDTRSRPHTPAAPDNELEELGNQDIDPAIFEAYANACNKGAEEQYLKEYAATIRKDEREKVLKETCAQCPVRNEEMPLEDYCAESCDGCLVRKVCTESLRREVQE